MTNSFQDDESTAHALVDTKFGYIIILFVENI